MRILVAVAIIQFISLKADEREVSMATSFAHGLTGPKDRLAVKISISLSV